MGTAMTNCMSTWVVNREMDTETREDIAKRERHLKLTLTFFGGGAVSSSELQRTSSKECKTQREIDNT